MIEETAALSLTEAMAENMPTWLYFWLVPLVLTNLVAVLFIVGRKAGQWIFRIEALSIIVSFMLAAQIMEWIYGELGYVRLLGVGHLVGWTPAYLWIWSRRKHHDPATTLFGKYLLVYLLMNGISLVIDFIDMIRYFVGI